MLAAALEAQDYSVWWDREIAGGAEFSAVIEKELDAAKTVIVAWSEHSLGSHWVRDEADYARGQNKLLPLSLDGVLAPLGFRQLHAIDCSSWNGDATHPGFVGIISALGGEPRTRDELELSFPGKEVTPGAPTLAIARPGVAILPFSNMSTDEEIEFLADGLTEDIITVLSHNRHLSVPARTLVFAYKGQTTDIREAAKALSVRYVVTGSIRKMGARARVTVQFINAETGAHIWANKFDQPLEELYETSDSIVEKIAGSLFAHLIWAEADRSEHVPDSALGPWDFSIRAAAQIGRGGGDMSIFFKIISDLKMALTLAPDYPLAHAIIAWAYNAALVNGMYKDGQFEEILSSAKFHLRTARQTAQGDLLCLTHIGAAENYAGLQERSLRTLEGVLARDPASAEAWYAICQPYLHLGHFEKAHDAISRATELAPEAGYAAHHQWYRSNIYWTAGDYERAAPLLDLHISNFPEYGYANALAAICADAMGDHSKALRSIQRIKDHNPQLRPDKLKLVILHQPDADKGKREYARLEKLWAERTG